MRNTLAWSRAAGLLCLILAAILLWLTWTTVNTASPFYLNHYAQAGIDLAFAALLLLLALTLLFRWRVRGLLLTLTGIALLTLAASPVKVAHLDWDGEGLTVTIRSLPELMRDGWQRRSVTTELVDFNGRPRGQTLIPPKACIEERVEARGLFRFSQRYRWRKPDDLTASRTGGMDKCDRFRHDLMAQLDGLEKALIRGDTDQARALLDQHHAKQGRLALRLSDVGEPLRGKLAGLLHSDPEYPAPLTLLDIALVLEDQAHARDWLPEGGALWYQRYALFTLGLDDLLQVEEPVRNTGFLSRQDNPMSITHQDKVGGYQGFDYTAADLYCDLDYARFLKKQGLVPRDSALLQLFMSRLWAVDTKGAMASDVHRRIRGVNLPILKSQAESPEECVALARFYTNPEPSAEVITLLRRATAATVFNHQQSMLSAELDTLSREERAAPHGKAAQKVHEQFEFSEKTLPTPPIVGMFTAVLEPRRDTNALCQALYVMPWMVSHDGALDTLYQLARRWRDQPIRLDMEGPPESICSLGLMMPPGSFAAQTRERDHFLEQAGLPCEMVLPKRTYIYSERLECRHER